MPSFVIADKCDGCKGGDKTACMYICPNDLMVLDPDEMKAYNQEPDQCWECFSCVKICPTQAIEVRGYADFVPLGSSVMPMLGTEDVMWTCKFRNGTIKRSIAVTVTEGMVREPGRSKSIGTLLKIRSSRPCGKTPA